jgi:archaeal flagellin FlaB
MKRKADMGIGTLIIFIAMILVAAIAAGVLIQTATSLQNKALLTGERSKSQVSTSIRPIVIYAEDGSSGNNVENIYLTLKLAPGSDAVRFGDLLLEFSLKNLSTDYTYITEDFEYVFNSTTNYTTTFGNITNATLNGYSCANFSNMAVLNETVNLKKYLIQYLIEGENYADGYLQRGDVAKLCFKTTRAVNEDESISITLVPKVGSPTAIQTALPDIITEQRINIFP